MREGHDGQFEVAATHLSSFDVLRYSHHNTAHFTHITKHTSGSISAARGKNAIGDRAWWFKLCSKVELLSAAVGEADDGKKCDSNADRRDWAGVDIASG
jgi:hypothetical protein